VRPGPQSSRADWQSGSVRRRDIDVNDRAGTFGSSVARGFADLALQPVLGLLPQWWTGIGGCHCAGLASGGADLAEDDSGDRIRFCVVGERSWGLRTYRHFAFFSFEGSRERADGP
jgi:hypothetical protein